ncbi:MAG: recombinase family protein [Paracoccaceae bacterium]|nr:recombinase family protein [Paracoccaceae bacterium]
MNTEAQHITGAFKAAQYVRMSTEHQQYSTQNQADKIQEYADKRGIEGCSWCLMTFKSGAKGRPLLLLLSGQL